MDPASGEEGAEEGREDVVDAEHSLMVLFLQDLIWVILAGDKTAYLHGVEVFGSARVGFGYGKRDG